MKVNSSSKKLHQIDVNKENTQEIKIFKTICKFEGHHENPFLRIEDNKLTIEKTNEVEKNLIKNQWIFDLGSVYSNNHSINSIFESEIIETKYFQNFFRDFKSNIIFLGNSTSSIYNENQFQSQFSSKCIEELLKLKENLNKEYGGKKFITVSITEVVNDKIYEMINFDVCQKKELKVYDKNSETFIDGVVEMKINTLSDFEDILKINQTNLGSNLNSKKKNTTNIPKSFKHQILTIRAYKTTRNFQYDEKYIDFQNPELSKLVSKLNIIVFQSYELSNEKFSLNTNENFKLINSIKNIQKIYNDFQKKNCTSTNISSQFRSCKISRIIKDTFLFNEKNLLFCCLPIHQDYLILVHNLLNTIKERKVNIEMEKRSEENSEENKENYSFYSNKSNQNDLNFSNNKISLNSDSSNKSTNNDNSKKEFNLFNSHNIRGANLENIYILLSKFEERLENDSTASEFRRLANL